MELRESVLGFTVEMGEGFEVRSDTDANDAAINGEQNPDPQHNNARARKHATEDAVDNMDVGTVAPLQMSKLCTAKHIVTGIEPWRRSRCAISWRCRRRRRSTGTASLTDFSSSGINTFI